MPIKIIEKIMEKEHSGIVKYADRVFKASLYLLVFLLPLFVVPWTSSALDFNKQALLMVLVSAALVSWMVKSLASGGVAANNNKIGWALGMFFLVSLASCVFSVFRNTSFWGWPFSGTENLLTIAYFCLFYFLVSTGLAKKELYNALLALSVSFLVAQTYGILQLFGLHVLPFSATKSMYFNTLGPVGIMGIFSVILLPLSTLLLVVSKSWWRVLFALNIALIGASLLVINYYFMWWLAGIGSLLLIASWLAKRDMFDARWTALPAFFLVVSVFFIVFQPQLGFIAPKPFEIFLSPKANVEIDIKTLQSSPLLGSGPGTFGYDFLKYKNRYLNDSSLWNAQFTMGSSMFLTMAATGGALGLLAWLAVVVTTFFYGIRRFLSSGSAGKSTKTLLLLAALLTLAVGTAAGFFYNTNISLDFIIFFSIAMASAIIFEDHKTYVLKPSSAVTLATTFVFTALVICSIVLMILQTRRYIALVDYHGSEKLFSEGKNDEGLKLLQKAANLDGLDLYYRQLAQAYLFLAKDVVKNNPSPDARSAEKLKAYVASAINSSKMATDKHPNGYENWVVRGDIYQSLVGLVPDANTWAITSYTAAIALNPNNPYLFLQRGNVYYQTKDYQNAKTNFDQALALKADYADAMYFMGLTYDQLGQKQNAIEAFSGILELSSITPAQTQSIRKIIENVNADKGALDGLGSQPLPSEPTAPGNPTVPVTGNQ